jgi:ATP-dependent DNA helicase RecG
MKLSLGLLTASRNPQEQTILRHMQIDSEEALRAALAAPSEDEGLEFKLAAQSFRKERICEYVSAIANSGGGSLILGVSDAPPRKFVGTQAFANLAGLRDHVYTAMRWKIETREFAPDGKRILVISTNAAPRGRPVAFNEKFFQRTGGSLRAMGADDLRIALSGASLDFSSDLCPGAGLSDLDQRAIDRFRALWSREPAIAAHGWTDAQLLENAELTIDGALTNAALILLGSERALARRLAHAELVFEYRSRESDVGFAERREFRSGLLLWLDEAWERINARNTVQQLRMGLFREDIVAFDENTLREAILNAICHRDYGDPSSCWVRMYPARIEVASPGGFPQGVTPENILDRQRPRNRRLAEGLKRCGLVERSGQGADLMFRRCIETSKPLPDFSRSDAHSVVLELRGEAADPAFIRFLEELGEERQQAFTTADLLVLDMARRGQSIKGPLAARCALLVDAGALERTGRGKFILSQRYRAFAGERPQYTREKGLSRGAEKALLRQHLEQSGARGAAMQELLLILPGRSRDYVKSRLEELRRDALVEVRGQRKQARWYALGV